MFAAALRDVLPTLPGWADATTAVDRFSRPTRGRRARLSLVTGSGVEHLQGRGLQTERLQIDCFADTPDDADSMARSLAAWASAAECPSGLGAYELMDVSGVRRLSLPATQGPGADADTFREIVEADFHFREGSPLPPLVRGSAYVLELRRRTGTEYTSFAGATGWAVELFASLHGATPVATGSAAIRSGDATRVDATVAATATAALAGYRYWLRVRYVDAIGAPQVLLPSTPVYPAAV